MQEQTLLHMQEQTLLHMQEQTLLHMQEQTLLHMQEQTLLHMQEQTLLHMQEQTLHSLFVLLHMHCSPLEMSSTVPIAQFIRACSFSVSLHFDAQLLFYSVHILAYYVKVRCIIVYSDT